MQTSDFEKISKILNKSKLLNPYIHYELCTTHYNGEEYAICYDDGYNKFKMLFSREGKIL